MRKAGSQEKTRKSLIPGFLLSFIVLEPQRLLHASAQKFFFNLNISQGAVPILSGYAAFSFPSYSSSAGLAPPDPALGAGTASSVLKKAIHGRLADAYLLGVVVGCRRAVGHSRSGHGDCPPP